MKKKIILSILGLFIGLSVFAQNTNGFDKQADLVFKAYNKPKTPGVAVGVIQDGKTLYLKGFGTGNLETNKSISEKTKFQLGELSKQFTSLAILLLEEQGKISLDDDIRNHLNELPEYDDTVTIRHLLNHCSGLHDINRINTILNGTDVIPNQTKAMDLVVSQKTLSFKPGSKFSFHEAVTESVLMAEIVERSSGQSFPDFVLANIFKPLEMNNSLIRDDSESILNDVAQPYRKEEGEKYKKNEVRSNVIGAINAYSSAEDMCKWYINFTNPKGSLGHMIQKLDTPVQLTNGNQFDYYWGKMTIGREFGHPERGLPIYWNFGFQGGYGSNIFRFKNEKIISFVLGNNNNYNGSLAMDAIDTLVKEHYTLPATVDYKTLKTKKMESSKLKSFEGNYWFQPAGYASKIFVENDTLRSQWLFSEMSIKMVPISENTFQQVSNSDEIRQFKFIKGDNGTTLYFKYNDSDPDIMKSYTPAKPTAEIIQSYTGTYFNTAYTSLITFHVDQGELIARTNGHKAIKYLPIKKDVFTSATLFMPSLEFIRDKSDKIIGIRIDGDGVHSLVFEKAN